jgi:hypothetical protein
MSVDADLRSGLRFESGRWFESLIYNFRLAVWCEFYYTWILQTLFKEKNALYFVLQCICKNIWHSLCSVDRCLYFCPFSIGHCAVYPSSIYGFVYSFGIFKLFLSIVPKKKGKSFMYSYTCFMWPSKWTLK